MSMKPRARRASSGTQVPVVAGFTVSFLGTEQDGGKSVLIRFVVGGLPDLQNSYGELAFDRARAAAKGRRLPKSVLFGLTER
jgi:hypothetical protein